jgi:hypothetical protein
VIENAKRRIYKAIDKEIDMVMEIGPLMNVAKKNEYLLASGYKTKEKRCSSSINVLEFCEVVQEFQQKYAPDEENEFVQLFLSEVDR